MLLVLGRPCSLPCLLHDTARPWALREEGLLAFWKGNSANVVRIFPYSAAQLMSNDYYKRLLASQAWGCLVQG